MAPTSSLPTDFFEGGINLTKLKVEACISSFLINTRASAAGDAELHDMISGKFDRCSPGLTTQASTNATDVLPGATGIFDTATIQVTGAASPDDATGTVSFYLCPAATPDCTSPQVGWAVTLNNADCVPASGSNTDGKSCAKSATTTAPSTPGKYCFRAVADLTNYDDPDAYTDTTRVLHGRADTNLDLDRTELDPTGFRDHHACSRGHGRVQPV